MQSELTVEPLLDSASRAQDALCVAMVQLSHVSFAYKGGTEEKCLDDVSLSIPRGQVLLLCGGSGCGKTTITRLVNGLIPQFFEGDLWGEVTVADVDVSVAPAADTARAVGSVFQNPRSQFFNVDTDSELAFGCENMGWDVRRIDAAVARVTDELGLRRLLGRNLFKLSGGEKQLIACASVSAYDPDVLVLDEPASNLDIAAIEVLAGVVAKWKAAGKTVIVAEHRLSYLMDVADRVVFMDGGRVVWDRPAAEVRAMPYAETARLGLRSLSPTVFAAREAGGGGGEGLDIRQLAFSYPGKRGDAPQGIDVRDVRVPLGSIVGIVGDNGAGKTTLSRCLCGLEKKASGVVLIDGKACSAAQRRRLCYLVMQDVNHQLFTESVLEEVLVSMRTSQKGRSEAERRKLAEEILESLDLSGCAQRHPQALSGGQKQRVAIAGALASDRSVMVFDQPTSGLDRRHMLDTADNLRGLAARGVTSLIVTHDPELVQECCDWIVLLGEGKALWSGPVNGEGAQRLDAFFGRGSAGTGVCSDVSRIGAAARA